MDFSFINHRFSAKIARWLAVAMSSTAVTVSTEIWAELAVIKWVALVIAVLMVLFSVGSAWAVIKQVPWRHYDNLGELIETAIQFLFLILAVVVGAYVA